ncbi:MAG: glutamine synthetase family protein [Thermoplasmatota archaeon]
MSDNISLPENIDSVALKFLDLQGKVREIRIPPNIIDIILKDGISFDSSNVGFTDVSESDMVALPDPSRYEIIHENGEKIAVFLCEMYWPDGKRFKGDPRYMLKKTLDELKKQGVTLRIKPEYEFHILNKETLEPIDTGRYIDGRSSCTKITGNISKSVREYGMRIEKVHHEVGDGQYEIEPLPYDDPMKAADDFIFVKDIVKKEAEKLGGYATFMPKPIVGEPGNGFHVHISLLKNGDYLFSPAKLNEEAKGFVGGLLKHAKALSAICCPTINSYKRLVPGYEAPVYISWGGENRSVLVRIPAYGNEEAAKGRVEFRAGDASVNIYLMLNSLIRAGMDGMKKGLDPGPETKENLYELTEKEIKEKGIELLPGNLSEALRELENDPVILESLGESYEHYLNIKKTEIENFNTVVTNWELDNYIEY